jgi:sulfate adenylyltransferase subunit 2
MVDDERFPIETGETVQEMLVRFRTLGCYPLTAAMKSDAKTLPDIVREILMTRISERSGRLMDHDGTSSMEKKKSEGYF